MATYYKVQFMFGAAKWGWTETFYAVDANDSNQIIAAISYLAPARQFFLSFDVVMEAVRITQLDDKLIEGAGSQVRYATDLGNNNVQDAMEDPWLCIQATAGMTGTPYKRVMLFRGLPKSMVAWSTASSVTPNFPSSLKTAWSVFNNVLVSAPVPGVNFGMRANNRDLGLNPKFGITALSVDPVTGHWLITVSGGPGWLLGERIHVGGMHGPGTKGANGDAVVTNVIGGSQFLLSTKPLCNEPVIMLIGKPYAQAKAYIFQQFNYTVLERYCKRDTGRPFFGTRGRRYAKRC